MKSVGSPITWKKILRKYRIAKVFGEWNLREEEKEYIKDQWKSWMGEDHYIVDPIGPRQVYFKMVGDIIKARRFWFRVWFFAFLALILMALSLACQIGLLRITLA